MIRLLRVPVLGLALFLLAGLLLSPITPAWADAGRWLDSRSYAELSTELAALAPSDGAPGPALSADQQARYDDLIALQAAITRSDDRAQVDNRSRHSLGVFARSKKAPAEAAPEFLVLAPGHETDDDFDMIGLYVPAGVDLAWGDGHGVSAAPVPRLARLLEGQHLRVSDPAVEGAATYQLDLPSFAVGGTTEQVASLPALSQDELDAHPETAPVD